MPKFWGSTVRHREPTGALDGFAEGAKSFAYGFGDGFGGLVYKPVLGGKKDVSEVHIVSCWSRGLVTEHVSTGTGMGRCR
jgi:hypothetical protein